MAADDPTLFDVGAEVQEGTESKERAEERDGIDALERADLGESTEVQERAEGIESTEQKERRSTARQDFLAGLVATWRFELREGRKPKKAERDAARRLAVEFNDRIDRLEIG